MVKVQRSSGVGGKWLDKKALVVGDVIRIETEAQEIANQQGGMQLVAKVTVKGWGKETENFAINVPSKNAIIEAHGDDTNDWIGKSFTVHPEKTIIGGKRGIVAYLIPDGFELQETDDGYVNIRRVGKSENKGDLPTVEYPENTVAPEDIPF